jgi:hypothetical protein
MDPDTVTTIGPVTRCAACGGDAREVTTTTNVGRTTDPYGCTSENTIYQFTLLKSLCEEYKSKIAQLEKENNELIERIDDMAFELVSIRCPR